MGGYRTMKWLFVIIDIITIAITYCLLVLAIYFHKIEGFEMYEYFMVSMLFLDYMKRELKTDIER